MENMKLQKSSFSCGIVVISNGSQKTVDIDIAEDIKILATDKDQGKKGGKAMETQLANFAEVEEKPTAEAKSLRHRLVRVFKGPIRGEDFTISQALLSVDMLILFISTTCRVETTLKAIDNMGQIGKSLGYTPVNIRTVVSLINIWNFLDCVIAV